MRDFYVVDTAFQLLCAAEARSVWGAGRESHLIIDARGGHDGRALNLKQMQALADDRWTSVSYNIYPRRKGLRRSLVRITAACRLRLRIGRAERLFCGIAADKWVKNYSTIYGAAEVVRTDDGTATIFALRDLRAAGTANDGLRAFSIFARPDDPKGIVKNRLSRLAAGRRADQQIRSDLVWLIGGAYSETAVLSFEDEQALFAKICARYAGRQLCYLPHRDDSAQKLAAFAALGMSLAPHGPNLERRLLDTPELPAELAGIASTALFTARLLQPELKICALRSPRIRKAGYDLIYAEALLHGIEVAEAD